MANSKLIIVEGPQGSGKTTATDFIRHSLKYTNLYRLCGTKDNTPTGLKKSEEMYYHLLNYIKGLENKSINLLFDRTFFTEEIYCRLGFKEYSFSDIYKKLVAQLDALDFDMYYITLYLENTELFKERLNRKDKAITDYAKFAIESSIKQQVEYLKLSEELEHISKSIKIYTLPNDSSDENLKSSLKSILNI